MKVPPGNDFTHACVLDVSIPKSFYLIDTPNNTFTLIEGKESATVTITPGNYSIRNLMVEVATALNSASPNNFVYEVTYPVPTAPDTGLLTFSVSANSGVQPSFQFSYNNVADVLGFARNSTNTFVSSDLTSTQVIDLQRESTLYIHSNLVGNDKDDVLQEVFANSNPDYSRIVWQCTCQELSSRTLASRALSNVYRFTLTNEDGVAINLNGQDMQITICLYKKTTISQLLTQAIKLNLFESLQKKKSSTLI